MTWSVGSGASASIILMLNVCVNRCGCNPRNQPLRAYPNNPAARKAMSAQAAQVPQGGPGEAGPRAQRVVPHHREHGLPAPRGRGLRPAGLRGEDPRVLDGLGGGRHGLLPAQRLQHRVRGAEERAGCRAQERLQTAAGDLPADPPLPTPTAAPGGRRSSIPGAGTSSSRCLPCPRRSSTRRRRR